MVVRVDDSVITELPVANIVVAAANCGPPSSALANPTICPLTESNFDS
jgi:hypothetical protein